MSFRFQREDSEVIELLKVGYSKCNDHGIQANSFLENLKISPILALSAVARTYRDSEININELQEPLCLLASIANYDINFKKILETRYAAIQTSQVDSSAQRSALALKNIIEKIFDICGSKPEVISHKKPSSLY